ncbi:hypothetical protein P692DRAFT_201780203 [Suillus brevipes Sb2]|nr:hypothetical protein P692DRAFT_201780203 [Suillus brevipes Sb2]
MAEPDIVTVERACRDTQFDGVITARQSRYRTERYVHRASSDSDCAKSERSSNRYVSAPASIL